MGIGVITLRLTTPGGAAVSDTSRTRILVSLGEDLPIASFEEMISYLRWFATAERLRGLREAPPEGRAEAWSGFLKATDPYPGTPENEAVRDYFLRIRTANQRFRDDAPVGWQSDRGTAYVALGDPDDIYDSNANDPTARVRQQVWIYREHRLQLVFVDQSGFGRWRLAPAGMSDLQNVIRRKLTIQQQ
jgi:GWxTD domain-containing protein